MARREFAKFLSNTIEGREVESLPYKPNEDDTFYWTLDVGNNWKVKFFEESPEIFQIIHRYQCEQNRLEEALAGWLAARINAKEI